MGAAVRPRNPSGSSEMLVTPVVAGRAGSGAARALSTRPLARRTSLSSASMSRCSSGMSCSPWYCAPHGPVSAGSSGGATWACSRTLRALRALPSPCSPARTARLGARWTNWPRPLACRRVWRGGLRRQEHNRSWGCALSAALARASRQGRGLRQEVGQERRWEGA